MSKFFAENWSVIASNPQVFFLFFILTVATTYIVTGHLLGSGLTATKERLEAAKDEITKLENDNDELKSQLSIHDVDINELKNAFSAQPKITVSKDEPKESKDGDIWVVPE